MFGIKCRFQRCKDWPPRFKESSIRPHQIWVPPWKRAISATVDLSSTRMVADRHRLAAYHNKHCWRFPGVPTSMTLNPKNMVLTDFFCYFRLWHTLRVNFCWNILEIDQDYLRTKFNWVVIRKRVEVSRLTGAECCASAWQVWVLCVAQ